MIAILLVLYFLAALLTFGISLAYWQRQWPTLAYDDRSDDVQASAVLAVLAPVSLPIVYVMSGRAKHGLLFWPRS